MPERGQVLVTNTTPLIALAAATGDLEVLRFLYRRVVVPLEVAEEVRAGGARAFGVDAFEGADWLDVQKSPVPMVPWLQNSLDRGEAAVIRNLSLTGSVGVLLKAKQLGYPVSMATAIQRMRDHGIWLSDRVVQFALSR